MGLFTSSTEKSVAKQYPSNPDLSRQHASGAEQDQYASHFSSSTSHIQHGIERGLDAVKDAAQYKGQGAEQDRYHEHFSPVAHGTDAHKVQQYAEKLADKARGGAVSSGSFGLGYDGQRRAEVLAGGNGLGAEQEQFGGHFGLHRQTVENAAARVQKGAQDVLDRK